MMKYILGICLMACLGCHSIPPGPKLKDQVAGTGELRLNVKFENVRSSNIHVYIDEDYIGKYMPPINYSYMTYKIPAGLRTIRVEATAKDKKATYEKRVLILGGDTHQIIDANLDLK